MPVVVLGGATAAAVAAAAAPDVASFVVELVAAGMAFGNEVGLVGFFCVTCGRRMGWNRKAENGARKCVSLNSRRKRARRGV